MSLEDAIRENTAAQIETNNLKREELNLRKQQFKFLSEGPISAIVEVPLPDATAPTEEWVETPAKPQRQPRKTAEPKVADAPEPEPVPQTVEPEPTPEPEKVETTDTGTPEEEVTAITIRAYCRPFLATSPEVKAANTAKIRSLLGKYDAKVSDDLTEEQLVPFLAELKEVLS